MSLPSFPPEALRIMEDLAQRVFELERRVLEIPAVPAAECCSYIVASTMLSAPNGGGGS